MFGGFGRRFLRLRVGAVLVVVAAAVLFGFAGASHATSGTLTAQLVANPDHGKVPLAVSFDGSGTTDDPSATITGWSITFGDGGTANGAGAPPADIPHTYNSAGTFTATLTVNDDAANSDQAQASVTTSLNQPPNAVLTSNPTPATGKAPLTITFDGSASSDPDGIIASWTLAFGDGTSVSSTDTGVSLASIQHTYSTAGNRTATLTVYDDNGASDQATVAVSAKANVAPTAHLTSTPTPATGKAVPTFHVVFDGSGSSDSDGSIASWSLNFGDGSTAATGTGTPGSSISHDYAAGSYTAVLTVTDDNGATNTASVAVTAKANLPPTAHLSVTPTSGKGPLNVSFNGSTSTDSDGSIASWRLDYGDGSTAATGSGTPGSNIQHTYAPSSNAYTATLTVTDDNGATGTATVSVTSRPNVPPTAHLSVTPSSGKGPLNVTFNGSTSSDSDGSIASWSLDFGDGTTAATGNGTPGSSIGHQYAPSSSAYTATLTVTDDSGASATATASVTSRPNVPPTAKLTASVTSGKSPLNVTFNGSQSSDSDGTLASWTLDYGDGSTASAGSGVPPTSISHTYQAGNWTATLTVKDDSGATATATVAIAVNAPPTASLSVDRSSGPAPLAVNFDGSKSTDSDGSIASWSLDFGDGTTAASGSGAPPSGIAHTYSQDANKTYTAKLTVTDNLGATATATVSVNVAVDQAPVADLRPSPAGGTTPVDVSFDASHSHDPDGSIASWSIDFGDGNGTGQQTGPLPTGLVHTYTNTGTSSVTYHALLTVSDGFKSSQISSSIKVDPVPTVSIADASVTEGGTENFVVTLSAVSTHDITVDYATADGTATSADYTGVQGTLTISAGSCGPNTTDCQISVPTTDDKLYEDNETFTVTLSNPQGATIDRGTATGTIVDNDPAPVVMIQGQARLEGNSGSPITRGQSWSDGGALELADASGFNVYPHQPFYVISPGSTWTAPQKGTNYTGPYTFSGKSGNILTGVSPAGSAVAGQIAFSPTPISLQVLLCDPSSPADPSKCIPTVSGKTTTIQFTTKDGTSDGTPPVPVKSGQDYVAACSQTGTGCSGPKSDPITINPGDSSASLDLSIIPNTKPQDTSRRFIVSLLSAANATLRVSTGLAVIIDDDAPVGSTLPTATSGDAINIGPHGAEITGSADAQGLPTTVFVQYGKTTAYGSKTDPTNLAAAFGVLPVTWVLDGLSPSTTYHYQVVAQHVDNGTAYGDDKTFRTLDPPPPPPPPPPPTMPTTTTTGGDNGGGVQEHLTAMSMKMITRTATPSRKGIVSITLSCAGNKLKRCRGALSLDINGKPAGQKTFSILAGQRQVIAIQLKTRAFTMLRSKKRVTFGVSYQYDDGDGITFASGSVKLIAPKMPPAKRATKNTK